ncbi:MAG: dihydrolipoyl dehydrogenase [Saprospiraceae bacterium]|nr:dihydrolipoyl dehydrogenase [Saprospiraceae bacterium]
MTYDLVVIGSGPGGYIAAIRAAQLGMKTAIIERYNTLGGTCLNVGCIPSKALLDSSEHYHQASSSFEEHGIGVSKLSLDMEKMIQRKNGVVDATVKGVDFLMKKNKIDVFHGHGSFVDTTHVQVIPDQGDAVTLEGKKIIIATGSKPTTPAMFNVDKKRVITSTEALNIDKLPKSMVIIGGGVIGLELGSVFARLGTQVDVVEFLDRIIPGMDADCSRELQRSLKKLGMKFHLGHQVTDVKATAKQVKISYKNKKDETGELTAEYCLVAIGRRPYTDNLGLDKIGLATDDKGRIPVDEHLQTSVAGVFAIGDVIQGQMLAHKAEEEGVFVAEFLAGQKPHIDYNLIPGVVYTWPEVSAVGQTEQQLKDAGIPYKSGKYPFKALGRARASNDLDGMVKVLAHQETDEILGVHIVGARAADLIAEAVALMEFRASAEDASRMSHAHPTFAEAFKEACLDATDSRALNM